jgi:hypothetical protein
VMPNDWTPKCSRTGRISKASELGTG